MSGFCRLIRNNSKNKANILTKPMEFDSTWIYSYLREMHAPQHLALKISTQYKTGIYSKDEIFAIEDPDIRRGLHFLAKGLLACGSMTKQVKSNDIFYISSGTWFGEEKLLTTEYFPQCRHFLSDSIVISLGRDASLELLNSDSGFPTYLWQCNGIWSWRNIEMSLALKHGSAAFRTLHGLCHLLELTDAPNGHLSADSLCSSDRFELQFNHDRLAKFCDLSRPRITTLLSKMESHGMLSKGYRHITLLDINRWRWLVHAIRSASCVPYRSDLDELASMWTNAAPPRPNETFNWGYRPNWNQAKNVELAA